MWVKKGFKTDQNSGLGKENKPTLVVFTGFLFDPQPFHAISLDSTQQPAQNSLVSEDGVDPFIDAEDIFAEASERIARHSPRARRGDEPLCG